MEMLVGIMFLFALTTCIFIVLWWKERQNAEDWRRMSQVGFELAIEEMEKERGKPFGPQEPRVNIAVRGRFLA